LTQLSKHAFSSAEGTLASLSAGIQKTKSEIASTFTIPKNIPVNNTAPQSGSQSQQVQTDVGTFLVNVIAADLNSTRVIVDTASDSDCHDNCPVLPLGTYAARSGAFAGINGPYFCPDSYPSCAGKTNSFDTLLMNKNKHYFNSDNNIYSNVPAVIFSGSSARFVGQSSQWGRDTGVDSVIANQPLLVSNGNVVFGGDDEAKRAGQGTRAFIGATGNTAYIGVVYNANVAQVARVLKAMGIQNALNLDSGGSIALWSNGRYLAGPGRNTPFGILFVRK
jgi:exopolysaccharide biosynthesis protein